MRYENLSDEPMGRADGTDRYGIPMCLRDEGERRGVTRDAIAG
jgi:hypothetical protein